MTFEQLRIFLAVAEHLHFTRAAEELYITQPAVSAAISTLEKEYGIRLFHRVGRHIEITEAGKLLEAEAQKILDQVVLTERGLRELNSLQRGELRLGSSLTVGNYWLPKRITQFKQEYPGIVVNCTLANAEEICEGTASGLFDLGLVNGEVKPTLRNLLEQEEVGLDRLQIVVGKTHPWYSRSKIEVEELLSTQWVMRESGSGVQQVFEQTLERLGIKPFQLNVVLVLTSSEMVRSVVEGGIGAAAISALMVQKELQLGTLRAIAVTQQEGSLTTLDIVQPVWKLKHRERFQSRAAVAFEQMLMNQTAQEDAAAEDAAVEGSAVGDPTLDDPAVGNPALC
ncbi:LysR family transcriptional regulator [Leptolyngbya sp. FACHB-541]|uniref:LysR substrate-binding domain-containing protein n=1 Tax=Leptolyngbya sp. FACHB-541 TaxID=2692810 RepID=UPI001689B9AD|nr:LysR substrate-binding domain-containing protein [Leptolyngbya sp. FACHB-541]MBD1998011.1 LysR family transcriptional regulator [Leptolyngbya sp. FACHB-541]